MYQTLDCLGWYSAGDDQKNDLPDNYDLELQQSIYLHCENPIYLIMNVKSEDAKNRGAVPIFLYETN